MFLAYAFYSWAHSSVNISYCQFLWHRCWFLRRQCRMFKCHGAVRLFYVHLVFSFAGKSSILVCTGHWWNVLRFIIQSDSNSLLYGVRQLNWSLLWKSSLLMLSMSNCLFVTFKHWHSVCICINHDRSGSSLVLSDKADLLPGC